MRVHEQERGTGWVYPGVYREVYTRVVYSPVHHGGYIARYTMVGIRHPDTMVGIRHPGTMVGMYSRYTMVGMYSRYTMGGITGAV